MLTNRNINKLKYIETKINDIDVIISMITTYKETNKQKDKQKANKQKNKQRKQTMQQANVYMYGSNSRQ